MHVRAALLPFVLLACALLAQAVPPAPSEEAPLISAYERKVLAKEMRTLGAEIHAARKTAGEDASLAPLKEALSAAKQTKDAAQIRASQRALSDAVETLLYAQDGMPAKIQRLVDVGNLLRYDTPDQQQQRRQNRTVTYAPPPVAPTNAPAATDSATNAPSSR